MEKERERDRDRKSAGRPRTVSFNACTKSKVRTFITGSSHVGQWDEKLHVMDGFGIYTYPDGTEYRGFFKDGLFHGYGRITLAHPYKLIFKGTFDCGQLINNYDEIHFKDGLPFHAKFDTEGNVSTDCWRYLHWVYKQTCRDILDRNLEVKARTCRRRVNTSCTSTRADYLKHYTPGVCEQGSAWHERNADVASLCMSQATSHSSLSRKQLVDETLVQACRHPEIDLSVDSTSTTEKEIDEYEDLCFRNT